MQLQIDPANIQGQPGPVRGLTLSLTQSWSWSPGFSAPVAGWLAFSNVRVSGAFEHLDHNGGDRPWAAGEARPARVFVPLSDAAIRHIEDKRGTEDLTFQVAWSVTWQTSAPATGGVVGGLRSSGSSSQMLVPRSRWVSLLAQMGWEDYSIFEVGRLVLDADPNMAEAIRQLDIAKQRLRDRDFPGCVSACAEAFESAAKYESQGNLKKGFEAIFERAFANSPDKAKGMDGVIKSLRDLMHPLGRHATYPRTHVYAEDAEFVYATTVAAFAMITRGIRR